LSRIAAQNLEALVGNKGESSEADDDKSYGIDTHYWSVIDRNKVIHFYQLKMLMTR
jgi:hypothetical protein